MSAIGEYVHLYGKNYELYGINRKTTDGVSAAAAYQAQKNASKNNAGKTLSSPLKTEVENGLKNILSGKVTQVASSDNIEVQQAVQNLLNQQISQEISKLSSGGLMQVQIPKSLSQINRNKGTAAVNISTIVKRLNEMEAYRHQLGKKRSPKATELKREMENIYHKFAEILNDISKMRGSLGLAKSGDIERIKQAIGNKGRLAYSNNSTMNLVSMINATIDSFNIPSLNLKETVIVPAGTIGAVAIDLANTTFEQDFKIKGAQVDVKDFFGKVNLSGLNESISLGDINNTTITNKISKGKIETEIGWDKPNITLSHSDVEMDTSAILTDNLPLYPLLEQLSDSFVNHWLNITVGHAYDSLASQHHKQMQESMLYSLLSVALKEKYTDDSIFIKKDGDKYKIYDLNDILNKTKLGSAVHHGFSFGNKRAATVEKRLDNIRRALHQSKLQYSINPQNIK